MISPKRLITHGCSFTRGQELDDPNDAWPSVVAKELNLPLLNLAKNGYSNDGIVQDLVETNIDANDLVIIMWSWKHRMLIVDDKGWFSCFPENSDPGTRNVVSNLLMAITNQDWLYKRWLTQIVLVQEYLKNKNIQYLFTTACDNQPKSPLIHLEDKIDKDYFLSWPTLNFQDFTESYGICPYGHPNKAAHFAFAQVILDKLNADYNIKP